jgi:cell division cycle protein 20 (cofactor of APC complex)
MSLSFFFTVTVEQPIKSSVCARWERKQQAGQQADRFIPNRANMDKQYQQSIAEGGVKSEDNLEMDSISSYTRALSNSSENLDNTRVLSFKNKAPLPKDGYQSSLKVLYSQQPGKKSTIELAKTTRHIPSAPVRILDAPDLVDDYYLNLLSWGSSNVLAVALQQRYEEYY